MADAPDPTVRPNTADVITPPAGPPPAGGPPAADRSLGDLLSELSTETTALVKQEVRLAKAEARQEVAEAGRGVGSAVAGGAVAYTGLIAIVIGLGWALGQLFDDDLIWLGILLVGLAVAAIGALLLKRGLDQLKALSPPLDTTAQTLKEDQQWLKQQTP